MMTVSDFPKFHKAIVPKKLKKFGMIVCPGCSKILPDDVYSCNKCNIKLTIENNTQSKSKVRK